MQTNTELVKVFQEHKHNLDLLVGPSEGLLAALPSLNIIDSKLTAPCDFSNPNPNHEITTKELSFEWSDHRILSTDSKVRITSQASIIHNTLIYTLFHFWAPGRGFYLLSLWRKLYDVTIYKWNLHLVLFVFNILQSLLLLLLYNFGFCPL